MKKKKLSKDSGKKLDEIILISNNILKKYKKKYLKKILMFLFIILDILTH